MRRGPLGTVCAPVIARSTSAICSSATRHSFQYSSPSGVSLTARVVRKKKTYTQVLLKAADRPADGGRRQAQTFCCTGEVACLRCFAKLFDAAQLKRVHAFICYRV